MAKIHGSVNWDEAGIYTDGRRGLSGEALIVAPTTDKQPPKILSSTWGLARNTLLKSTRLMVFGFAFNPYDKPVLVLIKEGGAKIRSVLLIDIHPHTERIQKLIPHAVVTSCLPPPEGDNNIQRWLRASDT